MVHAGTPVPVVRATLWCHDVLAGVPAELNQPLGLVHNISILHPQLHKLQAAPASERCVRLQVHAGHLGLVTTG